MRRQSPQQFAPFRHGRLGVGAGPVHHGEKVEIITAPDNTDTYAGRPGHAPDDDRGRGVIGGLPVGPVGDYQRQLRREGDQERLLFGGQRARFPALHSEHTDDVPAAHQRRRAEAPEILLADALEEAKLGMLCRVHEVHGVPGTRDQSYQAPDFTLASVRPKGAD